ncbi:serine acetyltransferase [Vibrio sp. S/42/10]|uniref:serine O-acetyltransferase n=1 Tax=Vibrio sp. S/42/10 TaxID=2914757 RepID=UPI002468BEA3|nr:serine acetyltransferase [Vibrio sp. S/42/10]MDH5881666.1 serine acetyltransferase [Vibrio sp. S/42/10]
MSIFDLILSDLYRYSRKTDKVTLIKYLLTNPFFCYLFFHRLSKSKHFLLRCISRIFRPYFSNKTGIQIPTKVKIGYALYIPHGNVVINSTTSIGNNGTICQYTSIGSTKKNAATIGSNVYIGPNVSIVESVKIKDNVVIGAGSVVLNDIDESSTVAGVPAKMINKNNVIEDIITNKFRYDDNE